MIEQFESRNINILIADSNRKHRHLVRSSLRNYQFTNIIDVPTISEARQALVANKFQMIIMHDDLDARGGIDFAKELRRSGRYYFDLPIIYMSGIATYDNIVNATNAGINEYVVTPFSPDTLYKRMRKTVYKPREFIKVDSYVGPCRRDGAMDIPGIIVPHVEDKRRKKDKIKIGDVVNLTKDQLIQQSIELLDPEHEQDAKKIAEITRKLRETSSDRLDDIVDILNK